MSFENMFEYTPLQFEVVLAVLSLTAAVFAAALFYYLLTARSITPRLRITSYLSAVVMVSAIIELGALAIRWNGAFDWNGSAFALADGELFANGFRYMNWSIDVPVLLTQLLVVGGITGAAFRSKWIQFIVAGLGMIWTGYIGQFDELEASQTAAPTERPPRTWGRQPRPSHKSRRTRRPRRPRPPRSPAPRRRD